MNESTARDSIDWLIAASGEAKALRVNLMGGEPFLRYDLLRMLIPYGQCRARQQGKQIHFGATSNCTLITDAILDFSRNCGLKFHCSIDGIPEVQNANRPLLGGGPTAAVVEANVKKILAYQPTVWARATLVPEAVPFLLESAKHLAGLGFRTMAFVVAYSCDWQQQHFQALRKQYRELGRFYVDRYVSGKPVNIQEFGKGLSLIHATNSPPRVPCSAGNADVMINPLGHIYPCNRFGPDICGGQFCLGKLGQPFNERLRAVFSQYNIHVDKKIDCGECRARSICQDWCHAACVECCSSLYEPGMAFCETKRALYDELTEIDDYLRCHHPEVLTTILREHQLVVKSTLGNT